MSIIEAISFKQSNGGINMSQEIEIEFKNLLIKSEYTKLLQAFNLNPEDAFKQVNYYFETSDLTLRENGSALRIRKKNDSYQLTLKQPHEKGLLETHDTLSKNEVRLWMNDEIIAKPNVGRQLEQLGISFNSLFFQGELTTNRIETPYKDTLIVLDHSQYNNLEDYELELEANNFAYGKQIFLELLTEHHIQQRKTPNKIKRFFNSVT